MRCAALVRAPRDPAEVETSRSNFRFARRIDLRLLEWMGSPNRSAPQRMTRRPAADASRKRTAESLVSRHAALNGRLCRDQSPAGRTPAARRRSARRDRLHRQQHDAIAEAAAAATSRPPASGPRAAPSSRRAHERRLVAPGRQQSAPGITLPAPVQRLDHSDAFCRLDPPVVPCPGAP